MNSRGITNYLMHPPVYFSVLLLIVLTVFHIRYGLMPAWENMNSDFPNYYTSSRLLIEGKNISQIYDDAWFQQKINELGINERGKFSPFPPPTAFVMLPVAFFNPLTAKRIFLSLNVAALLFTAYMFQKVSRLSYLVCINFLLLSGAALANNFLLGQLYMLLLMLITLGYWLSERDAEYSAGLLWGLGAAVKYFPVAFLPFLLYKKKWKTVFSMAAIVLIFNAVCYFFFGFEIYREFFGKIFFEHLNGDLSGQSKFAVQFQSWNSLLRNLFIYDPVENKTPFINSLAAFNFARGFIYIFFIAAAAFVLVKIRYDKSYFAKSTSLLCLLVFVLSPASASYHLLLLAFPAMLLVSTALHEYSYDFVLLFIMLYIMSGFAPVAVGQPEFSPLVHLYYRLWIVVLYFFVAAWYMLFSHRTVQVDVA